MRKEMKVLSLKHAVSVTHRLPRERRNCLGAPGPREAGGRGKSLLLTGGGGLQLSPPPRRWPGPHGTPRPPASPPAPVPPLPHHFGVFPPQNFNAGKVSYLAVGKSARMKKSILNTCVTWRPLSTCSIVPQGSLQRPGKPALGTVPSLNVTTHHQRSKPRQGNRGTRILMLYCKSPLL